MQTFVVPSTTISRTSDDLREEGLWVDHVSGCGKIDLAAVGDQMLCCRRMQRDHILFCACHGVRLGTMTRQIETYKQILR
jgi:hypothetical protein